MEENPEDEDECKTFFVSENMIDSKLEQFSNAKDIFEILSILSKFFISFNLLHPLNVSSKEQVRGNPFFGKRNSFIPLCPLHKPVKSIFSESSNTASVKSISKMYDVLFVVFLITSFNAFMTVLLTGPDKEIESDLRIPSIVMFSPKGFS
ncbi:MAG: hypothetical protein UH071_09330 [Paludibacteraceae bacterium]|nr:hypothetical protein [Paludibacteraceae bacterium]